MNIRCFEISCPSPAHAAGAVNHGGTAGDGFFQGIGIRQANRELPTARWQAFIVITIGADGRPYAVAGFNQVRHQAPADEAGRAGNEYR
jgi:hypothetical protein